MILHWAAQQVHRVDWLVWSCSGWGLSRHCNLLPPGCWLLNCARPGAFPHPLATAGWHHPYYPVYRGVSVVCSLWEDFKHRLEKWESVSCEHSAPGTTLDPAPWPASATFIQPAGKRSGTKGRWASLDREGEDTKLWGINEEVRTRDGEGRLKLLVNFPSKFC